MVRGIEGGPGPGAEMSAEAKISKLQAALDKGALEEASRKRREGLKRVGREMRSATLASGVSRSLDAKATEHGERVAKWQGGVELLQEQGLPSAKERVLVTPEKEQPIDVAYRYNNEHDRARAQRFIDILEKVRPDFEGESTVITPTTESEDDKAHRLERSLYPEKRRSFNNRKPKERMPLEEMTVAAPDREEPVRRRGNKWEKREEPAQEPVAVEAVTDQEAELDPLRRAEVKRAEQVEAEAGAEMEAWKAEKEKEAEDIAAKETARLVKKGLSKKRADIIMRAMEESSDYKPGMALPDTTDYGEEAAPEVAEAANNEGFAAAVQRRAASLRDTIGGYLSWATGRENKSKGKKAA